MCSKWAVSGIFWFFVNLSKSEKTPQLRHKWMWRNTSTTEVNIIIIIIIQNSGCSKWEKSFTTYSNNHSGLISYSTPWRETRGKLGTLREKYKKLHWDSKFSIYLSTYATQVKYSTTIWHSLRKKIGNDNIWVLLVNLHHPLLYCQLSQIGSSWAKKFFFHLLHISWKSLFFSLKKQTLYVTWVS